MKIFYKITAICVLILAATPVFAAGLFFESSGKALVQGQEFVVDVNLNSGNESINAVEGDVVFPEALLEVKEVRDGNSIINFWVDRPSISTGKIHFSGIIPGGYLSSKGLLFSVVFRARATGRTPLSFGAVQILRNDGKGSLATEKSLALELIISANITGADSQPLVFNDKALPESFAPQIGQSADLFEGKYFVAFAAQDKDSGIDRYEVREGMWGTFVSATSPFTLNNQQLNEKIYVKAIDKAGNERTEVLYPVNYIPWYKNYLILGILLAGAALVAYLFRKISWQKFLGAH